MREITHTWLRQSGLVAAILVSLLFVNSCVRVHRFNPTHGVAGTTVVIGGANFGATATQNTVKFNGVPVPSSDILSASKTAITAKVPAGAKTGPVSVTRLGAWSNTGISRDKFTVDDLHVSLAVPMHPQETGMWCWAASGEMVMDFLGHDVAQCVEANNRFGLNYCCNVSPTNSTPVTGCPKPQCVYGGWPEFDKYGFTFHRTSSTALTWDQLVHQVADLKKPIAFTWHWIGGGGHMMVITGIFTAGGINWVEVNNPWAPCYGEVQTITYDEYVERTDDHTHWDDFYDVTYVGGP